MTTTFVTRNTGESEWYSPPEIVDAARKVLGSIELDPASCAEANQTVNANRFYTVDQDGLKQDWHTEAAWVNPPYSKVASWVGKLLREYRAGNVKQAVLLVNNATDSKWFKSAAKFAAWICFPTGRPTFYRPGGEPGSGPLQGSAVLYFGSDGERFREVFSQFGIVVADLSEETADEQEIAALIHAALRTGADTYFEAGRLLALAKDKLGLEGDEWALWLRERGFGISEGYASKLMTIAGNEALAEFRITKPDDLPVAVDVLYTLARVPAELLRANGDQVRRRMSRDEADDLSRRLRAVEPKERQPKVSVKQLKHQLQVAENRIAELESEPGTESQEVRDLFTRYETGDIAQAMARVMQREEIQVLTRDGKHPELATAYEEFTTALSKLNKCLAEAKGKEEGQEE